MFIFVISLIIIVAFLLVLVVLAQNSKGGGISSEFGGSSTSQIMGVKKTGDLLERITWAFAIIIMALTLSTNFMIEDSSVSTQEGLISPNVEEAQKSEGALPDLAPIESTTPADNNSGTTESEDSGN